MSEMASVIRGKLIRREITERALVSGPERCPGGTAGWLDSQKTPVFRSWSCERLEMQPLCNKYSFISDLVELCLP